MHPVQTYDIQMNEFKGNGICVSDACTFTSKLINYREFIHFSTIL